MHIWLLSAAVWWPQCVVTSCTAFRLARVSHCADEIMAAQTTMTIVYICMRIVIITLPVQAIQACWLASAGRSSNTQRHAESQSCPPQRAASAYRQRRGTSVLNSHILNKHIEQTLKRQSTVEEQRWNDNTKQRWVLLLHLN
ncbi:hypothetical protein COO60DRAFT_767927 [Scenedesmus sp. NREL 46B-D3]|nr:hypothetical protein COO60DRAFT_767927 [Scenedesmus sp. NREL 46B-D3]